MYCTLLTLPDVFSLGSQESVYALYTRGIRAVELPNGFRYDGGLATKTIVAQTMTKYAELEVQAAASAKQFR